MALPHSSNSSPLSLSGSQHSRRGCSWNHLSAQLPRLKLGHRTLPIAHKDVMFLAQAQRDDARFRTGEVW